MNFFFIKTKDRDKSRTLHISLKLLLFRMSLFTVVCQQTRVWIAQLKLKEKENCVVVAVLITMDSNCLLGSSVTSPVICQKNKTPFTSSKPKPSEQNYQSNSSFLEVLTKNALCQELSAIARRRFRSVTKELIWCELHERAFFWLFC